MNADQRAVLERLDRFLTTLRERLGQLMQEGRAGVETLAAQRPDELGPALLALGALDAQYGDLKRALRDARNGPIGDELRRADAAANARGEFESLGIARCDEAGDELELAWLGFRLTTETNLLRRQYPLVERAMAEPVPCRQCGAPLRLAVPYEAEALSCRHCGTVTQGLPAPLVHSYFSRGQQLFADEAAWSQRLQSRRFASARINSKLPDLATLREWRALEVTYWQLREQARASFLRKPLDSAAMEVAMERFDRDELARHQPWNERAR